VHEAAVCRPVLKLYFCDGGALDFARSEVDHVTGRSLRPKRGPVRDFRTDILPLDQKGAPILTELPWIFPAVTARGRKEAPTGDDTGQIAAHTICALLRAAVRRHAKALGVDFGRLQRTHGALGSHVFRRLFGSYWAGEMGKLAYASALLHHRRVEVTAKHYCARDVSSMTLEVTEVDGPPHTGAVGHGVPGSREVTRMREDLERQIDEMRALREAERAERGARERDLTDEVVRLSDTVERLARDLDAERARLATLVAPLDARVPDAVEMLQLLRSEGMDLEGLMGLLSVARLFGHPGRKAA
jgi:hypothetical protein